MAYNILMMGAAYGSLLASSWCSGDKIHLVCLPAEADLINAEGFGVRLPIKGRKDPSSSTRASRRARSPPAPPRA